MNRETFFHPLALIDRGAQIGEGSRVWAGTHVMDGAQVGRNSNIGEHCFIEGGVTIGDGVTVKNNVALYNGAEIEDDVFLGPSCVFTNVVNPRAFISRKNAFKKTVVKRGASIGANATVICGCIVGRYALIGAGAVVTKNIPNYAMAYGCPAEVRGWVCRCGVKLVLQAKQSRCPECGETYIFHDGILQPAPQKIEKNFQ